jgi:hypothetical protein
VILIINSHFLRTEETGVEIKYYASMTMATKAHIFYHAGIPQNATY